MGLLQQSTARNVVFLMVASSDHLAALTGATVTVTLSKNGGAFAAAGGTVTEVSSGWYSIALTTTDTNTLGDLAVHCTATSGDPTDFKEQVVAFNPGDSVRLGLTALPNAAAEAAGGLYTRGTGAGQINQANAGNIDANAVRLSGTTQTARDLGTSVLLSSGTGTGQVSLSSGTVTVGTNNDKTGYALSAAGVQAIWDALTSALTTVGSIGKRIADFLTGDAFARLGAPAGASVSADVAAVKTDTGTLTTRLTATRAGNLDSLDATVSSRLATAGYTAPPTAATISTQVWTEPIPGAFGAGSAGAKLNAASAAGDPLATAVPGAYGAGTAGSIIGNLPGSVWDVPIASHTGAGSTGNKLNSLSGASGSGALTVTITVQNDVSHPVAGAQFWVTTDAGGTNIVASGTTDTFGHVTVFLNAGTYYGWASKPGENFTNPTTLAVS